MPDKIYNIRKFLDIVMVELDGSKQKEVWEQITLTMIAKHSLAYTNVNTYQKNKSLAAVSTTFFH